MKKLLLFFMSLFTFFSYGQLSEGFEGATFPPTGWATFDNGIGTAQSWGITTGTPGVGLGWIYAGTKSARILKENLNPDAIAEDWMVTPLVTIPTDGQLRFFARSTSPGEQGSIYKVKIATSTATQNNAADFTTTIATYTELDIINASSSPFFQQKTISLTAYAGQSIYIAFVMENDNGDAWIIDNVNVDQACTVVPTALTVTPLGVSATLNWTYTGPATQFAIEYGPAGFAQGTGTTVSPVTRPYNLTGLSPLTNYTYYVRALCGTDNASAWSTGMNFTTTAMPPVCGGNFVDSGGSTGNYANNETITTTICPVNAGDFVTVTFSSFNTESGYDFLRIYNGNSIAAPLLGTYSGTTLPPAFTSTAANGCLTFRFTSDGSVPSSGWTSNIACNPPPSCPRPTALTMSTVTSTTANVGWTSTGPATQWEVIWLPTGSPVPTAASVGTLTTANPFSITGLTSQTTYDVYVRAVCTAVTDLSLWSVKATFTTQPFYCAGDHFYDQGGASGNYLNSQTNVTTTICAENPGDVITVIFNTFGLESCCDSLRIYDGPTSASPLVGTYAGTALPPQYTATSVSGCLTFVFNSDSSVAGIGWDATIICSPPPPCRQPTLLTATNLTSTGATLSWTDVNTGVSSWQIVVQPAGSGYPTAVSTIINATTNPFNVTGLNPNTSYEFYVLSNCGAVDGLSFWSGPRTFNTLFPGCNGSSPAGNDCPTAAPVCNLDGYCGNTSSTYTVNTWPELTTAFCGSIDNNSFLTFQATSTSISLAVNVGNCFNGSDIQFMVFSAATCGSGPVTALNCFFQMTVGTNALNITGLTPGQVYYLMIDGFAGAVCDYSVTVTSGGSTSTNVVIAPTNPTICVNETVNLTATGGNGIYNWSPATGLSAVTGSTVTFTPPAPGVYTVTVQSTDANSLCATSDFVEITVLDLITPTFTAIAPFCENTTAPTLATTSNNGILGVWFPAVIDNVNSGIYTFTPNAGQCAVPVNVSVTVTPQLVPTFISPAPICSGTMAPTLPTTSNNGVTGSWMPAPANITTTTTYTFTPDAGQCAAVVTLDVQVLTSCTFGTVASAVMIDNCATTASGEFFNTTAGSETIGAITNVFPNSNLGTYVQNSGNLVLAGAELRTFKTATSNVCSANLNYRIYEVSSASGGFTIVPLTFLENCTAGTYPSGGNCNPLEQKWQNVASAVDMTLFTPGDYIVEVFYDVIGDNDDPAQCDDTIYLNNNGANYIANFSIQATPTFVSVNPITCNGTEGSITISGFNPGDTYSITYTDNTVTVGPANFVADVNGDIIISGLNAGTYADFNFMINGCTTTDNTPITLVNPVYTPTFNQVGPFCVGDVIILPTSSIEGFTGSWSPAVDNTQTTSYTFTPDGGQCATIVTSYSVVVNPAPSVTNVTSNSPVCFGSDVVFTVTGTPDASLNYTINSVGGTTVLDASGSATITITTPAVGNVVLTLTDVDNGACNTALTNSVTAIVRALPTVTALTPIDDSICLGSDAAFTITGSANTTVTYQIGGGANQTAILNSLGQSGTITITNPTVDVVVLLIDINDGICNNAISNTITIVVTSIPAPTIDAIVQPTCAVQTASFNVLSPLNSVLNTPGNLFISEVTDAGSGSLTYVEVYNGTGATVDLSNYKLKVHTNGNPTASCNLTLSGLLLNNDVVVIKLSTSPNTGGVTPDLSFTTCSGVNNNDNIRLATIGDVDLDSWGRTDGLGYTPSLAGYTYRRNTTAPLPSLVWDPADWTTLDPEDYTDVGSYSLYISNFEYILNDGTTTTTQTSTSFTGVAPGTYTLVAHDLLTGCFSEALTFTINGVTSTNSVTNFTYVTPVCILSATNPLPDTSAVGFTSGGTYTINSTNATINSSTGEIDLATSIAGTYIVTYSVAADATNCLNLGSSQFEIVINSLSTPVTSISYVTPVCILSATNPLPDNSVVGFVSGGTYTINSTNATINSSTGEIDLATSIAGTYTVTYSVAADATNCLNLGSSQFEIVINPLSTPVTNISYVTPVCVLSTTNPLPNTSVVGFVSGGTYSINSTDATINSTTGEIDLSTSVAGTYTVTYSVATNATSCVNLGSSQFIIVITPALVPTFSNIDVCAKSLVQFPSQSIEGYTGTWSPASIDTSVEGTTIYYFTPSNSCSEVGELTVVVNNCTIQKGISPNGDSLNDYFDLSSYDVSKLQIFNRYGKEVYSKSNYTIEWKGQANNGNALPDGTYYYVIEFNDMDSKTGWIYINKER